MQKHRESEVNSVYIEVSLQGHISLSITQKIQHNCDDLDLGVVDLPPDSLYLFLT
jgi:hypothetical protein